jgi:DNA-binding response OmpR family regulator
VTAPIRVLVADDEKNLRELLVRELLRKGHAVSGVADGRAALETPFRRAFRQLAVLVLVPGVGVVNQRNKHAISWSNFICAS